MEIKYKYKYTGRDCCKSRGMDNLFLDYSQLRYSKISPKLESQISYMKTD